MTYRQRIALNDRYNFIYLKSEDVIKVKIQNYNRETLHDANKDFFINAKVRKLTFTTEAIEIWKNLISQEKEYSLIDVQYCVNKLRLLYQPISTDSVLKLLKKEIE